MLILPLWRINFFITRQHSSLARFKAHSEYQTRTATSVDVGLPRRAAIHMIMQIYQQNDRGRWCSWSRYGGSDVFDIYDRYDGSRKKNVMHTTNIAVTKNYAYVSGSKTTTHERRNSRWDHQRITTNGVTWNSQFSSLCCACALLYE